MEFEALMQLIVGVGIVLFSVFCCVLFCLKRNRKAPEPIVTAVLPIVPLCCIAEALQDIKEKNAAEK